MSLKMCDQIPVHIWGVGADEEGSASFALVEEGGSAIGQPGFDAQLAVEHGGKVPPEQGIHHLEGWGGGW